MKVHLVQCLCPKRHCILGFAYEEGGEYDSITGPAALKEFVESSVAKGELNHHCHLCGAKEFFYEDGLTRFTSIQEALPHIAAVQADNIATRLRFDRERN